MRVIVNFALVFLLSLSVVASERLVSSAFISCSNDSVQISELYQRLTPLNERPSLNVFMSGMEGFFALKNEGRITNEKYVTVIDFSLSSNVRRLWVIDTDSLTIVHYSLVAHGKNTGGEYALNFSNNVNSHMSSLGLFVTGNTYSGKHGLSLILDGAEIGINDNAKKRSIVIHGADYATRDFIKQHRRLGRSFGCPALPPAKSAAIIETIKAGTCLFIYYPEKSYFKRSKYFKVAFI